MEIGKIYREQGYDKVDVLYKNLNSNSDFSSQSLTYHGSLESHLNFVGYFNQHPVNHAIHTSNVDFAVAMGLAGIYRGFVTAGIKGAAIEAGAETADAARVFTLGGTIRTSIKRRSS